MTLEDAFIALARVGPITSHTAVVPPDVCRQVFGYLQAYPLSTKDQAGSRVADLLKRDATTMAAFKRRDSAILKDCEKLIAAFQTMPDLVARALLSRLSETWPKPKTIQELGPVVSSIIKSAAQAHLTHGQREAKRREEDQRTADYRANTTPEQRAAFVKSVLERSRHGSGDRAA